jgi:NADPH2:quinone reductase
MKAILVKKRGGPENLVISEYPTPIPQKGFVLIQIKAFGINHAEFYMRKGDWGDTADIIGIECVGVVSEDPSGEYGKGQKVATMVGGMARSINGSYAEYINVPKANVIPFHSELPWNELAAIPEAYGTAWAMLNWSLDAKAGEVILIHGGTSTVGLASIVLAKQMGMRVIATTRSTTKTSVLKEMGADDVIIDEGKISDKVKRLYPDGVDKVIELVGNNSLPDSLSYIRPMGSIVLAGFLGGMGPLENFHPVFQIPNCVRLTSLGSTFVFGQKGFEYAKIPLQKIISDIGNGQIRNILRKTFAASDIADAHRLAELGEVNGKVVVEW